MKLYDVKTERSLACTLWSLADGVRTNVLMIYFENDSCLSDCF